MRRSEGERAGRTWTDGENQGRKARVRTVRKGKPERAGGRTDRQTDRQASWLVKATRVWLVESSTESLSRLAVRGSATDGEQKKKEGDGGSTQ